MPPKASSSGSKGPSKKTEQKQKAKVIEDKTFGLKNKKGAKQQKFIQQVHKQVQHGNVSAKKLEETKKKGEVDDISKEIFKPVQKIEKGADPKSILCAFFKQGQCAKGDKCKFSHDLTIERKSEKKSLYCDMRDDEQENMENWDEDKLKEVVEKKHGAENKGNQTDIICKFFVEAVEKNKYGWFWNCPNGPSCHYRHALPPGFVLKKDLKAMQKEAKENETSLEDWIETERHKLSDKHASLTKVTLETFVAWKKRKIQERKEDAKKLEDKKLRDFKAGNKIGLSGRDMFTFNPELAQDSDNEDDEADRGQTMDLSSRAYQNNGEGDEEIDQNEYKEIDIDDYYNFDETVTEEKLEKLKLETPDENVEIDEDLFDDDDEDIE